MTDAERIAYLTELARRGWPDHPTLELDVQPEWRSAAVRMEHKGEPLLLVEDHERAFEMIEAALLVGARLGEVVQNLAGREAAVMSAMGAWKRRCRRLEEALQTAGIPLPFGAGDVEMTDEDRPRSPGEVAFSALEKRDAGCWEAAAQEVLSKHPTASQRELERLRWYLEKLLNAYADSVDALSDEGDVEGETELAAHRATRRAHRIFVRELRALLSKEP